MYFYAKIVIALQATFLVTGAPKHSSRVPLYADESVQKFLMTYGYLPQSDQETQSLRTEDQLINAVKSLQSYGGIPVTGEIDEETKRLMKTPRCGLADIPDPRFATRSRFRTGNNRQKRYLVRGQTWKHHNLTWSLRTQEPGGLPTGQVRAALSRALDLWARNSKLTFQEINSDSADILVSFKRGYHGDGYPFDGRGQILAHAFFPGRDRGGDAHFDEEEIWLLEDESSNGEGTSLYAVAAHEFGHSLGLAHSSERGALMYPWYQGLSPNYELPEDDRNGIQQMYGAPQEKLWGPIDGGRHHERPAYPELPQRPRPTRPWTTTTTTTTTTHRPWRPRPTHPNHYPENPRDYPEHHPRKPDYGYTTDRRRPTQTPRTRPRPTTPAPKIPNTCDTSYDAITMFRSEIYVFKGRYFWRIRANGEVYDGYPAEITRLFPLPMDIDHVDAVYERLDTKMVFFIGKKYYVFNGAKIEYGFPRPLTDLGLPESLDKIDGAMIWGHNSRTYFFSGTMYWRFDEEENHVEWDYPRDMMMFAGVGYNIDSVFQYKDHKTYFFKGKGFWEFDDIHMRVAHEKQRLSAPVWMGCPKVPETDLDEEDGNNPKKAMIISGTSASSSQLPAVIHSLFLVTALLVKLS